MAPGNAPARRLHQSRGFVLVEQTDGSRNEEQEPDARYRRTLFRVRKKEQWPLAEHRYRPHLAPNGDVDA
jgi:hypothetical protein